MASPALSVTTGKRAGLSSLEAERIKTLEREVRELKKANEILRLASAFFRAGGARPPLEIVKTFIDTYRHRLGVEPICRLLQVAPSAYWRYAARQRNPALRSSRALRDEPLSDEIVRIWQANHQVYGAEKVWHQLKRDGRVVARCTVERLMRTLGLCGVSRGKIVRTTRSDPAISCSRDHVNRQFVAQRPNQLWVSDFTYVSTWQGFCLCSVYH